MLRPRAPGEPLVDPGRAQDLGGEVADDGHRRLPEHAPGERAPRCRARRERGRDQEAVRDHDELALRRSSSAR